MNMIEVQDEKPGVLKGRKMKLKIISVLIILLIGCAQSKLQPNSYCNDKTTWQEWDDLIRVHPHNKEMQVLHALRIGLCMKIEQGTISNKEAIDLFNQAHQAVIERAKKRKAISEKSEKM